MLSNLLKKSFYNSPAWLKKIYGALPYRLKFGNTYYNELDLINRSYSWDDKQCSSYITKELISLVNYAYDNVEFYKNLYDRHGIDINQIQNISDFESLPVINKKMLRETNDRIVSKKANRFNSIQANTGGSSGEPFSFLLPKNQYYRAWAYKRDMWGRAGYNVGDAVLSFRGHSFQNVLYEHQPIYNFYYVDSYQLDFKNAKSLVELIKRKEINFIHGYPSNIIRFIELLEEPVELPIKGVLPCSEKVDLHFKKIVKANFDAKIQPSYEQSEMTILASYGKNSDKYYFYPTYGYPELITKDNEVIHSDNKKGKLIGTTFSNKIMPLIRYETGDEAFWSEGDENRLEHFKCAQEIIGRVGEYIDLGYRKISVTALIYGQHLPIFDVSNQIQLYKGDSKLILLYVTNSKNVERNTIEETKNKLNTALEGKLDISIIQINEPIKTQSGKKKILLGIEYKKDVDQLIEQEH